MSGIAGLPLAHRRSTRWLQVAGAATVIGALILAPAAGAQESPEPAPPAAAGSSPIPAPAGPLDGIDAQLAFARSFLLGQGVTEDSTAIAALDQIAGVTGALGGLLTEKPATEEEEGEGLLPEESTPIADFLNPTLSTDCTEAGGNSVGLAVAVKGPALLPLPGVPAESAAFVFTALGAAPATEAQPAPLTVTWVNLSSGEYGSAPLLDRLNVDEGPGTVYTVVDTGPGTIIAAINGTLSTTAGDCTFLPTAGYVTIDPAVPAA